MNASLKPWLNKIHTGDTFSLLPTMPSECIDTTVTSIPYWAQRDYHIPPIIIGGNPLCDHSWKDNGLIKNMGGTNNHFGQFSSDKTHFALSLGCTCAVCGAWKGSFGLEPSPQKYVENVVFLGRLIWRVLKTTGSFYLNVGDAYGSHNSGGKNHAHNGKLPDEAEDVGLTINKPHIGFSEKFQMENNLLMMPARVCIALQEDGWILRNANIWNKLNPLPIGATNRFRSSYEYVFHFVKNNTPIYWVDSITRELVSEKPHQYYVHMHTGVTRATLPKRDVEADKDWFTKDEKGNSKFSLFKPVWQSHRYYFDLAGVRIPLSPNTHSYGKNGAYNAQLNQIKGADAYEANRQEKKESGVGFKIRYANPLGSSPTDVWSLSSQPLGEEFKHYASYPAKLVRLPILASCPKEVCSVCGKPRTRIVKASQDYQTFLGQNAESALSPKVGVLNGRVNGLEGWRRANSEYYTLGWSKCRCNAPFEAGVVLDPFAGIGTSLLVAMENGFDYVGFELNPEYVKMAEMRLKRSPVANTHRLTSFCGDV